MIETLKPKRPLVIIRGAGDLASGVAWRLFRCHFRVIMLELPSPLVLRRTVSFAAAVHAGAQQIEGVRARLATIDEATPSPDAIVVCVDAEGALIQRLHPEVVVDARMTKVANDTRLTDAPLVIGLGPGFTAGVDCHAVVETKRGHFLGRVYDSGAALPDSGEPGSLGGESRRRVVRAPADGLFETSLEPGALVEAGQVLGTVGAHPVRAEISGLLRGLMYSQTPVSARTKVGDIDPRPLAEIDLLSLSDKARAVAGGVLEAILHHWEARS